MNIKEKTTEEQAGKKFTKVDICQDEDKHMEDVARFLFSQYRKRKIHVEKG